MAAAVEEPRVTDMDDAPGPDSMGQSHRTKQNRLEKKCRKALSRLGLEPVKGINKVTIKKSKHFLLTITDVEVFKSPIADTYIVFGDAKIDDANPKNTISYADILNAAAASVEGNGVAAADTAATFAPSDATAATAPAEPAEEEVDATGVEDKDIELVMTQAACSRAEAIKALKSQNNDIVEAIMAASGI